jgi:hypothetical protein
MPQNPLDSGDDHSQSYSFSEEPNTPLLSTFAKIDHLQRCVVGIPVIQPSMPDSEA